MDDVMDDLKWKSSVDVMKSRMDESERTPESRNSKIAKLFRECEWVEVIPGRMQKKIVCDGKNYKRTMTVCQVCKTPWPIITALKNEVWKLINGGNGSHMCIICMEQELDRMLTTDDLTDAPCNREVMYLLRTRVMHTQFEVGDTVVALRNVKFCDGTEHKEGEEIVITEETIYYYNHTLNNSWYKKKESK